MTQSGSALLTWEIKNFLNLTSRQISPNFKLKQTQFYLGLYPKGALKDMMNHVAIFLYRSEQLPKTDLKVLWTIFLVNDQGEECYRKDIETNFTAQKEFLPIYGGLHHLDRDTILEPSSGLLPGGKLIIKSKVTILDDQNSVNIEGNKPITLAKNKALENYQSLLDSSKFSDVVFVIGKKEFKLHKNILASQSPVFAAMFENDLEEAKQNRVEITDVDVEVFESMIRFIYTTNVESIDQFSLELFETADKYQLESLKHICVHSLGCNLTIDSVANILLVADMHSAKELKSKCVQYINENASEVVVTEGWRQLIKRRHELVFELYQDLAGKSKFAK